MKDGYLNFAFNLGNGEGRLVYNATRVDDGKWHRIRATRLVGHKEQHSTHQNKQGGAVFFSNSHMIYSTRTEQTASLKVDNGHILTGASPGKLRQLNGNGRIYIGLTVTFY